MKSPIRWMIAIAAVGIATAITVTMAQEGGHAERTQEHRRDQQQGQAGTGLRIGLCRCHWRGRRKPSRARSTRVETDMRSS